MPQQLHAVCWLVLGVALAIAPNNDMAPRDLRQMSCTRKRVFAAELPQRSSCRGGKQPLASPPGNSDAVRLLLLSCVSAVRALMKATLANELGPLFITNCRCRVLTCIVDMQ